MATVITYDQFAPVKFGNHALITGIASFDTVTLGADLSQIANNFSARKVYDVIFSSAAGYTAHYNKSTHKVICFAPNAAIASNGASVTFNFTAIGQGGANGK